MATVGIGYVHQAFGEAVSQGDETASTAAGLGRSRPHWAPKAFAGNWRGTGASLGMQFRRNDRTRPPKASPPRRPGVEGYGSGLIRRRRHADGLPDDDGHEPI
jgi:hypothetical protein